MLARPLYSLYAPITPVLSMSYLQTVFGQVPHPPLILCSGKSSGALSFHMSYHLLPAGL